MDDINALISDLQQLFNIVSNTQMSTALISIGLILLLLGGLMARWASKSDPKDIPRWLQYVMSGCLVGGVLFCAAGPLLALLHLSKFPILRVSAEQAFDNLQTNERVSWLIRLIPYYADSQPDLSIGKLKQIGPPDQQYTFVAADDELGGYRVDKAVRMTGISYSDGQRVSAIIFPVPHQSTDRTSALYPANARGLLQVIQNIELAPQDGRPIAKPLFADADTLITDEATDLRNFQALYNWRWSNYFAHYPRYCQIAHDFECTLPAYSARSYLSGPNTDWHPLGLARKGTQTDPCDVPAQNYCKVPDSNSADNSWRQMKTDLFKDFGSRVFLIKNLPIDSIKDRVLIDFGEPDKQYIPNMSLRPSPDG